MKQDIRYFGQILSKLNCKVNKRSSYIHNSTLKYHSGEFSHDRVINNLKSELYMQTPRAYMPFDVKTKDLSDIKMHITRSRRSIDSSILMPLQTSIIKFQSKSVSKKPNRPAFISKKRIRMNLKRRTSDADNNTEL